MTYMFAAKKRGLSYFREAGNVHLFLIPLSCQSFAPLCTYSSLAIVLYVHGQCCTLLFSLLFSVFSIPYCALCLVSVACRVLRQIALSSLLRIWDTARTHGAAGPSFSVFSFASERGLLLNIASQGTQV